jgi:tetratricopeptide (TPR) repeat protein
MKYFVLIFINLIGHFFALAQQVKIDSLEHLRNTLADNERKVLILNDLSAQFIGFDTLKASKYLQEALMLSRKLRDRKGESKVLYTLGEYHHRQGKYVLGIEYISQSLKIAQSIKDTLAIANAYYMQSIIYTDGLKLYDLALQNCELGLPFSKKTGDKSLLSNIYNLMAWIYGMTNQQIPLAQQLSNQAIQLAIQVKDKRNLAYCIGTKALLFEKSQQLDSALYYFNEANKYLNLAPDKAVMAYNYVFIGNIYRQQNRNLLAIKTFQEAIELAKSMNAREFLKDAYGGLAQSYALEKQYEQAFHYQYLYTQIKDSLHTWEINQKIALNQHLAAEEQQKERIQLLEKEKGYAQRETRNYIIFLAGIVFLISIILGFTVRMNRQRKKANMLLQEKNEEIAGQSEELQLINEELITQRDGLDEQVQKRTQTLKIANTRLKNYAFANSHKVRRPVATILGLLSLFDRDNLAHPYHQNLIEMLNKTAQELEQVTREINQVLESEGDDEME